MNSAVFEFYASVFNIAQGDMERDNLCLKDKVSLFAAQIRDKKELTVMDEVDTCEDLWLLLRFYFFSVLIESEKIDCIPTPLLPFYSTFVSLSHEAKGKLHRQRDEVHEFMSKDSEIILVLHMWQQAVEAKNVF